MFGSTFAVKGGLGTASHKVPGADVDVSAIVVVNAVGDIDNPDTRQILAGARQEEGRGFRDAMSAIMGGYHVVTSTGSNTTIGAVATNVPFNKAKMTKIAWMAHGGFARSINPVHTMSDGDAIFTLFTGKALSVKADVLAISAIPATVMAQAVPVRLFKPRVWPTINSLPIETMWRTSYTLYIVRPMIKVGS